VVQKVDFWTQPSPEASISTQILSPDPTTSEAYRVYPIVDPTSFGKVLETNMASFVNSLTCRLQQLLKILESTSSSNDK